MSFVYVCHSLLSKAIFHEDFVFKQEEKIKFQISTSLYSLWNNSYSLSQSNNKRFQRQFNVLRNLSHAQNSLPLATNLFSFATNIFYIFCIHHFICPFREPVSSNLLPFLIECNSIPYTFLLKTHIFFFSNHGLSCILAFYRLVNINEWYMHEGIAVALGVKPWLQTFDK